MPNKFQPEKDAQGEPTPLDGLDIGPPPPTVESVSQPTPDAAPQQPSVDTIAPPKRPVAPDIAPPPPPPPEKQVAEQSPLAPEQTAPAEQQPSTEVQQPGVSAATQQTAAPTQPLPTQQKTQTRKEIEDLLSDGLTEIYQTMTPQQQEIFRKKGDEAAAAIEEMVTGFRATARKVVELIRGWLQTIPGVNKFFLEQESKLKTDDILKLQRRLKKQQRLKQLNVK